MLEHLPPASPELIEGYLCAAGLADQRRQELVSCGRTATAVVWARVSDYCSTMAKLKAIDDDQHKGQRDQLRHRQGGFDVIPMTAEQMDAAGVATVQEAVQRQVKRQLSATTRAIIRLALSHLSPLQHVCFELVEGDLLEAKDVAAALKITPAQVRQHVMRAKHTIKTKVRPLIEDLIPGRTVYDPAMWYVKKSAS